MSLVHDIAVEPPQAKRAGAAALRVNWPAILRGAAFVGLGLAAIVFSIAYVGREQPIYYWDWGSYFRAYQVFGALAASDPLAWVGSLFDSIREADYNFAIVTPMMPVHRLFGDSRAAYVATIIAFYLVPAAAMAARLAARGLMGRDGPAPLWLFATALVFWPLWMSALRGLPDVAGLVPLGLATLLVIETRFLTRASVLHGFGLGLLVWSAFLLRRWYAYADVALEAATLGFALWTAVRSDVPRSAFRAAAGAFAANVVAAATLVVLFQLPLAVRIVHTSYGEIYAAYQKPLSETAHLFVTQTGIILLVAAAAGLVRAVLVRNAAVLFMAAAAALTSVLFLQTQAPGIQHILPVCFWMFPVALLGALWPLADTQPSPFRIALVPAIMLAGFGAVLVPEAGVLRVGAAPLLPEQAYYPLRLDDDRPYRRLIGDLEVLLKAPSARLTVFATSQGLSDSLLASLEPRLRGKIVHAKDVDARDGLRLAPFAARFAIVTARPALHLPPRTQQVVSIPNALIYAGTGPGAAYHRRSGPYVLDGGIEAYVYERERPLTSGDEEAWTRLVQAVYPRWVRGADGIVR